MKTKVFFIIIVCILCGVIFFKDTPLQVKPDFYIAEENIDKNFKISYNIPIPNELIKKEEPKEEIIEPIIEEKPIINIVKHYVPKENTNYEIQNEEDWVKFQATGYDACVKCCGNNYGITACGAKAQAGVTIAMPKEYAFGTKVLIKDSNGNLLNNGTPYIVQDRGGAIKNHILDIFFNSHKEALNWGRRTVFIKVID